MSDKKSPNFGTSASFLLFLLFLGLKLTNLISWSWWWVTAPLWGGLALAMFVLLLVFCGALIKAARS